VRWYFFVWLFGLFVVLREIRGRATKFFVHGAREPTRRGFVTKGPATRPGHARRTPEVGQFRTPSAWELESMGGISARRHPPQQMRTLVASPASPADGFLTRAYYTR